MSDRLSPTASRGQSGTAQGTKVKDPRWLRVDICRDFAAGKCKRLETECRFAHPKKDCVSENSKVTVCYDSMKDKCCRENCKFYHPPYHIKEYLLAFGKHLQQMRMERERQQDDVLSSETVVRQEGEEGHNKTVPSDKTSPIVAETTLGHNISQYHHTENASRRHSYGIGQPPVYDNQLCLYEDNTGAVFYAPIQSASFPAWSTPQRVYFNGHQRAVTSPVAFMYQPYLCTAVPVLEPRANFHQPYSPFEPGGQVLVTGGQHYYQTAPPMLIAAQPQPGIISTGWPLNQAHVEMNIGNSTEVNRPNSI